MIAGLLLRICTVDVAIPAGLAVPLVTIEALSSKRNVKGDIVGLRTNEDIRIGAHLVIPAGTAAVGQISDSRTKGAMGMTGSLTIRPLYLRLGTAVLRLTGSAARKGTLPTGSVLGFVITPGFTGRSAVIPAGTEVAAASERPATVRIEGVC